jgi:signal transduction histidine kinase
MNQWEIRESAFFGRITAGITHELKNVLAIIRESAGLMEDIISISPDALISHQDRLRRALKKIDDQVGRGVELTDRLNKFAHSSDAALAKIDLLTVIEQLVALSQRFARLKNVVLDSDVPTGSGYQFPIVTRPVPLQMALFAAIECCISVMPAEGGQITVKAEKKKDQYAVHILCGGDWSAINEFSDSLPALEKWPVLQQTVASLQGSAELNKEACGLILRLPEGL